MEKKKKKSSLREKAKKNQRSKEKSKGRLMISNTDEEPDPGDAGEAAEEEMEG